MKNHLFNRAIISFIVSICTIISSFAQVGIGTTDPEPSSLLDVRSITKGIIIPRMTLTQRDAIDTPVEGLQIYNTTSHSLDIYVDSGWRSFAYSENSNLVYVYTIDDLPEPVSNAITLDANKMYIFSGIVDISPNYLVMNGAGLKGTDPQKDGVTSTVSGAIIRSVDTSVFIQDFSVILTASGSKAYDFSDSTGTKYCNLFSGCSVIEVSPSLGVGQVSGFVAATFVKNFWRASDGIKVTGTIGKFASTLNFITGIGSGGSGIEFLAGLNANDIDLANNYFDYIGQTGITVNAGASIDLARLTSNLFRGVSIPLTGVDSFSPGWSMSQNTNIPNSRAAGSIYFNSNTSTTTGLGNPATFLKITGTTTALNQQRFTASNNRLTYNGLNPIVAKVSTVIGAKAPSNGSSFSLGISKNGGSVSAPIASMGTTTNNQAFQVTLNTEINLTTGDFIEVFISSGTSSSLVITDLQLRVTD